jgi:hypothetical protein
MQNAPLIAEMLKVPSNTINDIGWLNTFVAIAKKHVNPNSANRKVYTPQLMRFAHDDQRLRAYTNIR